MIAALLMNLPLRWREWRERRAERRRGADNVYARLWALLGR